MKPGRKQIPATAPLALSRAAVKVLVRLVIRERQVPGALVSVDGDTYHAFRVLDLANEIALGCTDTSVGLSQLAQAGLITVCRLHQVKPGDDTSWCYVTRFTEAGRVWCEMAPEDAA